MADITSYPQIPATVWWGVRSILEKTPKATINENFLSAQLSVQTAAARQYVLELRRVGILNDDSRATDLALKWRLPDSYAEAVAELIKRNYGEDLPALAPSSDERDRAVAWFKGQGLGEGSAKNKAATYFLISSQEPGEAISKASSGKTGRSQPQRASSKQAEVQHVKPAAASRSSETSDTPPFPVNLNLQIHISAEATVSQIDAIFASMKRHLGNAKLS